jgi:HAD superfamily hydrolase (TIGR01509 family)
MKKLIIFDLDGVLVDAKEIHFNALNSALASIDPKYCISLQEHLSMYDGLKTHAKINLLNKAKNLPTEYNDTIWKKKQQATEELIESISTNQDLINLLIKIKSEGIKIACCSNSIRSTCYKILSKTGIIEYFDLIISNEDVKNSKPHPEMYWKAMSLLNVLPEETLIIEDSPVGLMGAEKSGASVCRVKNTSDVTLNKIQLKLFNNMNDNNTIWQDEKLNVLIPMAGAGSRFEQAGYTFPKPLIDVNGSPMIQVVVNNLNFESKHTFIVQKSHREKYNLNSMLSLISKNCNIVEVDGLTEGAACTTLLAKEYINNDNPLVIANSDQYVEWNTSEFMYKMQEQDIDAGILCFNATHPKWSFAKVDDDGFVIEVAEKKPISNIATTGIYYWKKGSDYVKYAEQMISSNIRHNNEFYVCPVFNEAIKDGKKIKAYMIDKMWGIGTPEDLNTFLNR